MRKPYHKKTPTLNGLTVREIVEAEGFDPLVELIRAAKGKMVERDKNGDPILDEHGQPMKIPVLEPRLFVEACSKLADFVYPRLRCAEVRQELDAKFTINVKHFDERAPLPEPKPRASVVDTVLITDGN